MRLRYAIAAIACMGIMQSMALDISQRYRSPRNPERKVRSATTLIILHTTEAPARSSLNKLSDRGEAHYCVTEVGQIYAIVDRDREAFHAGRSMWCAKEDVDKFSIGIECVGYHNKPMPTVQLTAICDLVKELQRMYRLSDDKVIAHSHVAYGAPNRWQKRRHRGRKRCGMLFAMPTIRRMLKLRAKPSFDPDTRAGRLTVGDDYLQRVLYGNVDTMAAAYGKGAAAPAAAESKTSWIARIFSSDTPAKTTASKPSTAKPAAAKPTPTKPATSKAAGVSAAAPKSIAQLKAGGWVLRGCVSKNNAASKIAGKRWNAADTYYTIRDKVISGAQIDPARIEKGMGVWTRK